MSDEIPQFVTEGIEDIFNAPPKTHKTVRILCRMCQEPQTLQLSIAGLKAREEGALVQDAFPELTAGEREMLISQTCDNCWKKLFGEPEEDTDDDNSEDPV